MAAAPNESAAPAVVAVSALEAVPVAASTSWLVPRPGFVAAMVEPIPIDRRRRPPLRVLPGGRDEPGLPRTHTGRTFGDPAELPAA
jgi:hypothetical protein